MMCNGSRWALRTVAAVALKLNAWARSKHAQRPQPFWPRFWRHFWFSFALLLFVRIATPSWLSPPSTMSFMAVAWPRRSVRRAASRWRTESATRASTASGSPAGPPTRWPRSRTRTASSATTRCTTSTATRASSSVATSTSSTSSSSGAGATRKHATSSPPLTAASARATSRWSWTLSRRRRDAEAVVLALTARRRATASRARLARSSPIRTRPCSPPKRPCSRRSALCELDDKQSTKKQERLAVTSALWSRSFRPTLTSSRQRLARKRAVPSKLRYLDSSWRSADDLSWTSLLKLYNFVLWKNVARKTLPEYFMYQSLCFKGYFLSWFISWLSIFSHIWFDSSRRRGVLWSWIDVRVVIICLHARGARVFLCRSSSIYDMINTKNNWK